MARSDKQSGSSQVPAGRRIRPQPTVREKSEREQARSAQPSRGRRVGQAVATPLRPVGRGLGRVGRLKPFHVLGLVLWPPYFRNSFRELRQVSWPSRRQTLQLTFAVIVFSVIFGVVIAGVDFGLDKVFKKVILKQ